MALPKDSGGSGVRLLLGGCHPMRAAMTPTLLNALSQNGAAIPIAPTRMPPIAGPTARLTLMPTLFAATAAGRSAFDTS